jgi:hypothetical protein
MQGFPDRRGRLPAHGKQILEKMDRIKNYFFRLDSAASGIDYL